MRRWMHRIRVPALSVLLALAATLQGQRNLGLYAICFLLLHTGTREDVVTPWRRLTARIPAPRRAAVPRPAPRLERAARARVPLELNTALYLAPGEPVIGSEEQLTPDDR